MKATRLKLALAMAACAASACSQEQPARSASNEPYLLTETPEPRPDPAMTAPDPGPPPATTGQPANGVNNIAPSPAAGNPSPTAGNPSPTAGNPSPTAGAFVPASGSTDRNAPAATGTPSPSSPAAAGATTGVAPDNTKKNERDRDSAALTPGDQGNNETDLKITQKIRQAVMADGSLSFTAKNVKIITVGGKVTLRGPVKTDAERAAIETAARSVAGATQVDNQIEVKK